MIGYFCAECRMYYRELELGKGKRCPECGESVKPHLILGGIVMGDTTFWPDGPSKGNMKE